MSKNPPSRVAIPDDWSGGYTCYIVRVPSSKKWLRAFKTALYLLSRGRFWDRKTGIIKNAQQLGIEIFDSVTKLEDCFEPLIAQIVERLSEQSEGNMCGNNCCCCNQSGTPAIPCSSTVPPETVPTGPSVPEPWLPDDPPLPTTPPIDPIPENILCDRANWFLDVVINGLAYVIEQLESGSITSPEEVQDLLELVDEVLEGANEFYQLLWQGYLAIVSYLAYPITNAILTNLTECFVELANPLICAITTADNAYTAKQQFRAVISDSSFNWVKKQAMLSWVTMFDFSRIYDNAIGDTPIEFINSSCDCVSAPPTPPEMETTFTFLNVGGTNTNFATGDIIYTGRVYQISSTLFNLFGTSDEAQRITFEVDVPPIPNEPDTHLGIVVTSLSGYVSRNGAGAGGTATHDDYTIHFPTGDSDDRIIRIFEWDGIVVSQQDMRRFTALAEQDSNWSMTFYFVEKVGSYSSFA